MTLGCPRLPCFGAAPLRLGSRLAEVGHSEPPVPRRAWCVRVSMLLGGLCFHIASIACHRALHRGPSRGIHRRGFDALALVCVVRRGRTEGPRDFGTGTVGRVLYTQAGDDPSTTALPNINVDERPGFVPRPPFFFSFFFWGASPPTSPRAYGQGRKFDASAGSPTDTLLRLLLPSSAGARATSCLGQSEELAKAPSR